MPATEYYAQLSALQTAPPVEIVTVLYKLNTAVAPAVDVFQIGYLVGDQLYSDAQLSAPIEAATVASMGKRIIEEVPWQLDAPDTATDAIPLLFAVGVSSFHAVSAHPGGGLTVPIQLEVAGKVALPASDDFALYDATEGRQVFVDDTATEQLTIVPTPSYTWLRLARTDSAGEGTDSTVINGQITIAYEVP